MDQQEVGTSSEKTLGPKKEVLARSGPKKKEEEETPEFTTEQKDWKTQKTVVFEVFVTVMY